MANASVDEAMNFHAAAQGQDEQADIVVEMAGDIVAGSTLLPADADAATVKDYKDKATRAELFVFAWLWDTKGFLSSASSLVGSSVSYQSNSTVLGIVKNSMPKYFVEPEAVSGGSDDGKAYVGRL